MPVFGIDAHAAPNPGFFGLADQGIRLVLEKIHLAGQLVRLPEVVRIQKSDQLTACGLDTLVARRADAPVDLPQASQAVIIA